MASLAGHFAYELIGARRKRFVRKNRWRLGVVALVIVVLSTAVYLVRSGFQIPLWLAVATALFLPFVTGRELFDGTYHLVNGLTAEKWTGRELRRRLSRGWHVVDWISFGTHDVDYVVVGPAGVYAIETKYTDAVIDLESPKGRHRTLEWLNQAFDGARSVRLLLQTLGHSVAVTPLVVVWGGEITGCAQTIDGAWIVRGKDLQKHLSFWRDLPPKSWVQPGGGDARVSGRLLLDAPRVRTFKPPLTTRESRKCKDHAMGGVSTHLQRMRDQVRGQWRLRHDRDALHCNKCGKEWWWEFGPQGPVGKSTDPPACACGGTFTEEALPRCPRCGSDDFGSEPEGLHILYD